MKEESVIKNANNSTVQKKNKFIIWIKENWWKVLISLGSVVIVAILASVFTDVESEWYLNLIKPAFYPPEVLFPIVWSLLYINLGVVLFVLIYQKQGNRKIYILYGVNGLINILWTLVFFTLHSTIFGLILLGANLIAGVLLFLEVRKANKGWGYVLIPYVLWLVFAFVLNYLIYLLN